MNLQRWNVGTKIAALLVVGLGLGASSRAEAEGNLVAVWYGIIENYAGDVPDRVLAIRDDGTCYWGVYIKGKKTNWSKSKCDLNHRAGKVELVTNAKSQVSLSLVDKDNLKGHFLAEYHGGYRPYSLQMRRIEHPEQYAPR